MDVRERLELELRRCHADASEAHCRAGEIAAAYIGRRLTQLDARFARHAWGWSPATTWATGLRVVPAVWGDHNAVTVARLAARRLGRREAFLGIERVAGEIDALGRRVAHEFRTTVPTTLSPRGRAWGVDFGLLHPDSVANRRRAHGVGGLVTRS